MGVEVHGRGFAKKRQSRRNQVLTD